MLKGHKVKGAQAHRKLQSRGFSTNTAHNFPQQPGAVFQTATVAPWAVYRTQQFMTEIAVTVLDIHKVKSRLLCPYPRLNKILSHPANLVIAHCRGIRGNIEPWVKNGMMVNNLGLATFMVVGFG